jgi:hypothetical protein
MSADEIRVRLAEVERALEARLNHLKIIDHQPTQKSTPPGSVFD